MFLFKMHSIGSVRPIPRASAMVNASWWNRDQTQEKKQEEQEQEQAQEQAQAQEQEKKEPQEEPNDLGEEVVVIQEEEMVLVCKDSSAQDSSAQDSSAQDSSALNPQPACTEPESTVSAPSKPKYKKKQQKRK